MTVSCDVVSVGSRPHQRRVGPVLLAAALVAGVLAGCSGQSTASAPMETLKVTPTHVTPSPTATTPLVPVLPAAAKEKTLAGAEAFTDYYLDLIGYAYVTNDIKPLQRVSHPDNGTTRWYIQDIDRRKNIGEVLTKSDVFHPKFSNRGHWLEADLMQLDFSLSVDEIPILTKQGADKIPAAKETGHSAFVRWTQGYWSMDGIAKHPGDGQ